MKTSIFVESSKNHKVGRPGVEVSATYATIAGTCPDSCSLKGTGCYAQYGNVAIQVNRIDDAYKGAPADTLTLARREARQIRESFEGGPIPHDGEGDVRALRIHVSGDARTPSAARELASAAWNWVKRGGGNVWSYTHAWKQVKRNVWGAVSVLASIEDPKLASQVRRQGYAPALVVPTHPADGKAWKDSSGNTWIPCPAQTRETVSCVDCKLCWRADSLFERRAGITFAAHGVKQKSLRGRLSLTVVA